MLRSLLLLNVLFQLLNFTSESFHLILSGLIVLLDLFFFISSFFFLFLLFAELFGLVFNISFLEFNFLVLLEFQVSHFFFVCGLLLFELFLVVSLELGRKAFTLLVFFVHLPQIDLKLFKQTINGSHVLSLNLINLLFVPLLHLKTFLLKLKVTVSFLLEFLFKEFFDFLHFFVVILLDLSHCFLVLVLL